MITALLLLLVIVFCVANLAVGICAAGFFGYGPLRHSPLVHFISDPVIQPPAFMQSRLKR